MLRRSGLWAALAVVLALVVVPSAEAAAPSEVFGGDVSCAAQPLKGDIIACEGATQTWDGTRISVNVFLPPESSGTGPYPLIGDFHGWGGSKQGLTTETGLGGEATFQQEDARIQHWAEEGYAVFSMSDRGWGESCGAEDPELSEPECANGYNHLMDDRYEVRDAEYLMGELAEEELVEPKKIGVTGYSYGGGMSMALAALRDRVMLPTGELVPWENEEGEELEIAAAVPEWPWTDLAYALAPNGRNLDYVTNSPYRGPEGNLPIGVMKYSWDEGLYQVGAEISNYNEADPEADIPGWIQRLEAGDPYTDSGIQGIINELTTFHSSYYIEHAEAPSPLLIQSGWNDDLFPVDEALRFYERTRAQYASDPISLFFADYGHARSQNKTDAVIRFDERLEAWFAHYLKGEGESPSSTVETMTTTCPPSEPSEGPFAAKDWSALSPGEIRLQTSGSQTITHGTVAEEKTPTESGAFFDPIVGPKYGKNACSTVSSADNPRAANYRLGAAPAGGYTLMGSPTIIATVEAPSPNSEIAARLLDENPATGEESLIARGLYRPTGGTQQMLFQLHPQGYHFAAGHVAKLELLPSDFPYGRFSNLQTNITVSNLELRLPVMQAPGSLGGLVQTPAPKVVPAGYTLAKEFETSTGGGGTGGGGGGGSTTTPTPAPVTKVGTGSISGKLTTSSTKLTVPMTCGGEGACSGQLTVTISQSGKKTTLAKGTYKITAGKKAKVQFSLTKAGRKLVKSAVAKQTKSLTAQVLLNDSGQSGSQKSRRAVNLPRAH